MKKLKSNCIKNSLICLSLLVVFYGDTRCFAVEKMKQQNPISLHGGILLYV